MKKLLLIAALLVCSATHATEWDTIGVGSNSCISYLDEPTDSDVDFMYVSWAQGAISMHLMSKGRLASKEILDMAFLRTMLNRYCKEKPEQMFSTAVLRYMKYLEQREYGA